MQSIARSCTVCSTTMVLFDRQPVDEEHDVLFFECPLCGTSSQTVTYSTTSPANQALSAGRNEGCDDQEVS
jgi:hypothetical protein